MKIHQNKSISCEKCPSTFSAMTHYTKHQKNVHCRDQESYKCEECDKEFKNRDSFRNHVMCVHDKLKKFKCSQCDKAFSIEQYLTKHIFRIHQSTTEIIHECNLCEKKFFSKDTMGIHKRVVHEEKYSCCKICNKKFASTSTLKLHINSVHLGERKHKCELCSTTFTAKSSLLGHKRRVHEKETNFKCDICGKDFFQRSELSQHIKKLHQNIQSPEDICPICKKQFKSGSKFLQEHIENIHNNIKNHECDMCGKSFSGLSDLSIHRKTVHNNETFTCYICHKSLRKSFFKRHMAIHEKLIKTSQVVADSFMDARGIKDDNSVDVKLGQDILSIMDKPKLLLTKHEIKK